MADKTNSRSVEPEHLLLGLLAKQWRENYVPIGRFLPAGQTPEILERKIFSHIFRSNCQIVSRVSHQHGSVIVPNELLMSKKTKLVFKSVLERAVGPEVNHIGPEYLIFGILVHRNLFAARILKESGVTIQSVYEYISA